MKQRVSPQLQGKPDLGLNLSQLHVASLRAALLTWLFAETSACHCSCAHCRSLAAIATSCDNRGLVHTLWSWSKEAKSGRDVPKALWQKAKPNGSHHIHQHFQGCMTQNATFYQCLFYQCIFMCHRITAHADMGGLLHTYLIHMQAAQIQI